MKLQVPFIQLPLQFDAARLAAEMHGLGDSAWREHPLKYPGNYALPLIAVDGDPDNDGVSGAMRPTPYLQRCPYFSQVLAHLGAVWGHTRLMKLTAGAEVTPHVDINYYWSERMRVHVPIETQPGVRFVCGEAEVNMGAGECWLFDTWRMHRVVNVPGHERVHLVADTVGGDRFWDIAARGRVPGQAGADGWQADRFIDGGAGAADQLLLESVNVPAVMTPWELREHMQFLLADVRQPEPRFGFVQQAVARFTTSWHALWAQFGEAREGWLAYRALLDNVDGWMERNASTLQLVNGMGFVRVWRSMVLRAALANYAASGEMETRDVPAAADGVVAPARAARTQALFDRPIFIVSPPRSGSTMLFEALAQSPDVFTIGGENHRLLEVDVASGALGTIARGYASNQLGAADATPAIAAELRERYYAMLTDRAGQPPSGRVRLLEKTPKNALRVPFLASVFPDALFVYLYRDPREVLASMLEAWESGRFRTYLGLPGWTGLPWSLLLIPGWRELIGRPLADVVAAQWRTTTRVLLDDLDALPPERRFAVRYDAIVGDPDGVIGGLCRSLGIGWDRRLGAKLPPARYTVSAPRPQKWQAREAEVLPVVAGLADVIARAEAAAGA
jgi:hypothetical protein